MKTSFALLFIGLVGAIAVTFIVLFVLERRKSMYVKNNLQSNTGQMFARPGDVLQMSGCFKSITCTGLSTPSATPS